VKKRIVSSLGYFHDQEEANRIRLETQKQLNLPSDRPRRKAVSSVLDRRPTIQTLFSKFLIERRSLNYRRTSNTESLYKHWIEHHPLALMPIVHVTKGDCQAWLNWLEVQPKKRGGGTMNALSIRNVRNVLSAVLDYAVKHQIILVNPCEGLVYRAQDRNISRIKKNVLLPHEIAELTTNEKIDLRFRLLYRFAIFTGLRTGEIATLHRNDVHLEHVDRDAKPAPFVYVRYGGHEAGHFLPPKSKQTRRVPLLPPAVDAVREQLSRSKGSALLFPSKDDDVSGAWSKDLRRHLAWGKPPVGIFPGLPFDFHSLRRTCATGLTAGFFGRVWSLEETQSHLGHASRSTTEIYARYGTTLAEQAAQKHASEARRAVSGVSEESGVTLH